VRCAECVKEGERSTVHEGMSTTTCAGGGGRYWDEDGNEQMHYANTRTTEYHCSKGHMWTESERAP